MSLNKQRIYMQMRPDPITAEVLGDLGKELSRVSKTGYRTWKTELHLTLIHFGKGANVLKAVRQKVVISYADYGKHLQEYVEATQALLTDEEYELKPLGYGRLGSRDTTLIVRYAVPEEIVRIHSKAYDVLLKFIESCGIANPQQFADEDPNFKMAKVFQPHIIIFKGYEGADPAAPLPTCRARFAPLVYDKYGYEIKSWR